jgi:hypothetical protein
MRPLSLGILVVRTAHEKSHHPLSQRQWVKGAKDVREVRLSGQDGREDVGKLYQFATHR